MKAQLTIAAALVLLPCAATALAQSGLPRDQAVSGRGAAERSAAAGGSAVVEREDPGEAQRVFRALDRNGDGCLTPDELWTPASQQQNWAAADRNGNGCITPDEFRVLRPR